MPLSFSSFSACSGFTTDTQPQAENEDLADAELQGLDQSGDEENNTSEIDTISKRLCGLQEELLTSLKEDISEWIVKTLGNTDINADNFIHALDTGIILCKLSMIIEKKANECVEKGLLKEPLPNYKLHCDETAVSGTWYARDNTTNFLKWCRAYGMTDETMFDSEDLVTHHQERQVIYCLMELARLGARYGLEPPSLINMEKEIDIEIAPSPIPTECIPLDEETKVESPPTPRRVMSCPLEPPVRSPTPTRQSQHSILDTEVYKVSQKCQCQDFVNKLGDGVFNVYGKRVFVRLHNGKHVMVRVGGGWDTFENYLLHHDPVEVFRFSHGSQHGAFKNSSFSESNSGQHGHKSYLVIRSKYKSRSFCSHENS